MFALILICFFLPFITISCQGSPVIKMSGLQMATGVEMADPSASLNSAFGGVPSTPKTQKIPGTPAVGITFCLAGVGLATSLLLKNRQRYLAQAIAGGLGVLLLLWVKSSTDDAVLKQGGIIQVNYDAGFWLAFLLFLGATGLNGYQYLEDRKP